MRLQEGCRLLSPEGGTGIKDLFPRWLALMAGEWHQPLEQASVSPQAELSTCCLSVLPKWGWHHSERTIQEEGSQAGAATSNGPSVRGITKVGPTLKETRMQRVLP